MVAAIIVVLVLHAMKTHDKRRIGRLLGASLLGVAFLFAGAYMIRTEPPFSRIVLILSAVLIPLLVLVERLAYSRFLGTKGTQKG